MSSRPTYTATAPWWGPTHEQQARAGRKAPLPAATAPARLLRRRGPAADLAAGVAPFLLWALLWGLFLAAVV